MSIPPPSDDLPNYVSVPKDYPSAFVPGAVSGAHPKLLLTSSLDGKFYSAGAAPEARWYDWQYSLKMVSAMVDRCIESKSGKRSHLSEPEIILQYYQRALNAKGRYGTKEQLQWTFTQVAAALGWLLPDACRCGDLVDQGPNSSTEA